MDNTFLWAARVNLARAERAEAEIARLKERIRFTLKRYENPNEPHNKEGGFPRPQLGWAMAMDLYELIEEPKDEED